MDADIHGSVGRHRAFGVGSSESPISEDKTASKSGFKKNETLNEKQPTSLKKLLINKTSAVQKQVTDKVKEVQGQVVNKTKKLQENVVKKGEHLKEQASDAAGAICVIGYNTLVPKPKTAEAVKIKSPQVEIKYPDLRIFLKDKLNITFDKVDEYVKILDKKAIENKLNSIDNSSDLSPAQKLEEMKNVVNEINQSITLIIKFGLSKEEAKRVIEYSSNRIIELKKNKNDPKIETATVIPGTNCVFMDKADTLGYLIIPDKGLKEYIESKGATVYNNTDNKVMDFESGILMGVSKDLSKDITFPTDYSKVKEENPIMWDILTNDFNIQPKDARDFIKYSFEERYTNYEAILRSIRNSDRITPEQKANAEKDFIAEIYNLLLMKGLKKA